MFAIGQKLEITQSGLDTTGDTVEFRGECAGGVIKVRTMDSEPVDGFIPASWVAAL